MKPLLPRYVGAITRGLSAVAGLSIGFMYGGPVGALLLATTLPVIINAIDRLSWNDINDRFVNWLQTVKPFTHTYEKFGAGYDTMHLLGVIFTACTLMSGTGYFAPALAPYFLDCISKVWQARVAEIVCTNLVCSWTGSMIDQQNTFWQDKLVKKRMELEQQSGHTKQVTI